MNFKSQMNQNLFLSCFLISCLIGLGSVCNAKSKPKNSYFTSVEIVESTDHKINLISLDNDKFKIVYNRASEKFKIIYNGLSQEFNWSFSYGRKMQVYYKNNQVIIVLPVGYGTAYYTEELHMLDLNDLSKNIVLKENDVRQIVNKSMTNSQITIENGKTYLNLSFDKLLKNDTMEEFKIDISDICRDLNLTEKEKTDLKSCLGDIIRYHISELGDIKLELPIGVQNCYNDNSLFIDIFIDNNGMIKCKLDKNTKVVMSK